MNDKEWDDYIRQQPGTFWGEWAKEHDWSRHFRPGDPKYMGQAAGGQAGTSTTPSRSRGPGLLDGLFDLTDWVMSRLPPFKRLMEFGRSILHVKWRLRMILAAAGAMLCATLIAGPESQAAVWSWGRDALHGVAGGHAMHAALLVGALTGWFSPHIVGVSLGMAAYLTAFALALAVVAAVLGLVYLVVAAIADWPPFDNAPPAKASVHKPRQ